MDKGNRKATAYSVEGGLPGDRKGTGGGIGKEKERTEGLVSLKSGAVAMNEESDMSDKAEIIWLNIVSSECGKVWFVC